METQQQNKKSVDDILASLPTRADVLEYTKTELQRLEIGLTNALKIVMDKELWKN